MSRPFDVMVAGHLCLDIIPQFPHGGAATLEEILSPGKLVEIGEATISTGGAVSNTGISLRKLGNQVCFCAQIGDDAFGRLILEVLSDTGSTEGIRTVAGQASSYTVVIAPPHIDRMFLHNPGTNNEFGPEDLQPELIAQSRIFHFGYPPIMRRVYENDGEGLEKVLRIAKEAGATTSLDMALPDPASPSGKAPWPAILERTLPLVDVFLPSFEEVYYMLEPKAFLEMRKSQGRKELIDLRGTEEVGRMAGRLLGMGCTMVGLKLGKHGFYFRSRSREAVETMGAARPDDARPWADRELWCPAFCAPKLASATGSGDAAIAGFLSALLNGMGPEKTLKCAVCVAWQNLRELDATSGVGTWQQTLELVRQGMPMYEVRIDGPGWHWSESHGLWAGPNDPLTRS